MTVSSSEQVEVSRYVDFSRREWSALRNQMPLPLSEAEVAPLGGLIDPVSLEEVVEVYLPLSRLLNLYVAATEQRHHATSTFLQSDQLRVPYVIGVAGSVAVGKSTTSRLLKTLLSHWPGRPNVALVTTDGFLLPQRELEAKGLAARKGFPESYDQRRLVRFLADVKAGVPSVDAPVYSHLAYDIVPGEFQRVSEPDIVIVEGLNVLQTRGRRGARPSPMFVSDFFDFSIYVDAAEDDIQHWYVERFMRLRDTVFTNPSSYFHKYASLTSGEAIDTAHDIWRTINRVNLRDNVLPTRERAHLILEKGRDHGVRSVRLRKV